MYRKYGAVFAQHETANLTWYSLETLREHRLKEKERFDEEKKVQKGVPCFLSSTLESCDRDVPE